jgi:hypothetical protein
MTPLWKPVPYYFFRDQELLKKIKRNQVSTGIAALKIFILICLKSEVDEDGIYSAKLTYDKITEICSISRKLTSEGLRFLEKNNVIEVTGERKKNIFLIIAGK